MLIWLAFAACATAVYISGVQLAKSGDVIAEQTGLGRTWIGVVLLATVTSLPEAFTGFSAVVIVDAPQIAVGDIAGSCAFNLLIIALLDSTSRTAPLLSRVSQGHVLSAAFAVVLIGVALAGMLAADVLPRILWFSPVSPILVLGYLFAMRTIFNYERRQRLTLTGSGAMPAGEATFADVDMRHVYYVFAFNALVIVVAATFLPEIGQRIADQTGLGESFVGTMFVAITTSLPEIAIALTAVNIGASDLALGGVLGSNLIDMGILGFDDILYRPGPIMLEIQAAQAVTLVAAAVMTGIVIIGLTLQPSRKPPYLAWDALAIIGVYFLGTALLYSMS
jgi:cation:H+ antiporter